METNFTEEGRSQASAADPRYVRAAQIFQTALGIALSALPVLLLLFYLAPAVSFLGIGGETVYGLLRDTEMGLGSCAVALLVNTCAAVFFAAPLLLGICFEKASPLVPPFLILETCLQIALLIASATLTARISEGGLGLMEIGAAPILALVFSSLAVLCGGAYVVIAFLPSFDPYGLAPHFGNVNVANGARTFPYVSVAAFGIFGVAMFLFLLAPVATLAGEPVVTFYETLRETLPVYTDCTVAMLVFAGVTVLTVFLQLSSLIAGKPAAMPILTAVSACLSLAQTILASVVIGQIGKEGMFGVGAGPILVLVFSLFMVLFGSVAVAVLSPRKGRKRGA